MSHWISFPGLNIDPFKLDPVAFNLGDIALPLDRNVMWYGIIICIGLILGVLYAEGRFKKEGLSENDFFNMILIVVPVAIISARLYYVIFDPTPNYNSFLDVIAIWRGGIGIYGAIIGGAITLIVYSKIKKLPLLKVLDAFAPAVMIGQIIGRWGNFFNAEAHGGFTSLPWRMGIAPYFDNIPFDPEHMLYYHPTFLYESLWNALGLLIIHFVILKNKKYDGESAFFYLFWYGLGRGLIELLRTDSLRILGLKVSSLVGFLSAIIFGIIFFVNLKKKGEKNGNNT